MIDDTRHPHCACPDCEAEAALPLPNRREFLKTVGRTVGGVVLASAAARILPAVAQTAAPKATGKPETLVKTLYDSLTPKQKEMICMSWDNPLRNKVGANWAIVKQTIAETFTADQQEMVKGILRGVTTEEWYPKILDQMKNDGGGLEQYHVALFGDPDSSKFEWVMTGRHCTLRADGHSNANAAFGGPIFYGHAPKDTEDPGHPGNIYWVQGRKANAVFAALDGKQRAQALFDKAPSEDQIKLQGMGGPLPGIAIGELSKDQKALVEATMHDLLSPYRPDDAKEVMRDIAANGGLDKIHLSFYKQDALGHDGTWDIWRLEGPSLVWHFRGAPHVHTWVNIAKDPKTADGHV
ncbi:MAG TPA: DUF3500 domain-containing protein [Chthonomonadaceae bacterium]|nr:DUF3500 domain-containing protein [Chthonomonadaceae bacterium]